MPGARRFRRFFGANAQCKGCCFACGGAPAALLPCLRELYRVVKAGVISARREQRSVPAHYFSRRRDNAARARGSAPARGPCLLRREFAAVCSAQEEVLPRGVQSHADAFRQPAMPRRFTAFCSQRCCAAL